MTNATMVTVWKQVQVPVVFDLARLEKLLSRNAGYSNPLATSEFDETHLLIEAAPVDESTKCSFCEDHPIKGYGLCKGHTNYILHTGK